MERLFGFFGMSLLCGALIGLGHQGKGAYLPAFQEVGFAKLVAVCDCDSSTFMGIDSSLRVYSDYEELLDKEDLDFVVIATPHDTHLDIVRAAALRGVHVLKEKPFARTVLEAEEFSSIAKESGIFLRTYPQRRFSPLLECWAQFYSQVGRPFFIDIQYHFFIENPHFGWRGIKEVAGGGCIIDMGYHMIDLLVSFFGLPMEVYSHFSMKAYPRRPETLIFDSARQRPIEAQRSERGGSLPLGQGDEEDRLDKVAASRKSKFQADGGIVPNGNFDCEDTVAGLFSYENGLYGSFFFSRYFPPKTEKFTLLGPNGRVEMSPSEIRRFQANGELVETRSIPSGGLQSLVVSQIDHFCKSLNGDEPIEIDHFDHQMKVLAFVEACYESRRQRCPVNPYEHLRGGVCVS